MVGGTGINELKVFDRKNNFKPVASIIDVTEGVYALDYSNHSHKFAFAGGEGVVYIMGLIDNRELWYDKIIIYNYFL